MEVGQLLRERQVLCGSRVCVESDFSVKGEFSVEVEFCVDLKIYVDFEYRVGLELYVNVDFSVDFKVLCSRILCGRNLRREGFIKSPQAAVSPVIEEPEGLSARLCVKYKQTTNLFFSSIGTAGVFVQSSRSLM